MAKLQSLEDSEEFVNVLYYGEPGSGKTTDAASMAKLGTIVYIDAEAGLKRQPMQRLKIPTTRILQYKVETFDDLQSLYWQLKAKIEKQREEREAAEAAGTPLSEEELAKHIIGVVFDSMTEIQKKLLEGITNARFEKSKAQAERAGMVNQDDPFATDRDEWGKMTEMCRRVTRQFRDLECHTAFVCLDRREVDKEATEGGVFYRPALTPAFSTDLMGYVDVVIYTGREEVDDLKDESQFVGTTVATGKYRGKDRYGVLPPAFPNPTFDRVVKFVREADADDPQAWALEDEFVRRRLIRIGELPDPKAEAADVGL
ncbi:Sak4-like ssDNA annealing protein [Streptomyces phage Hiyaa]|jgi:hypothetical protein|uniref:DNA recombinase n=1 Tax=Streptomyces phage Hiyaa TaxID=2499072 RepID=A0A3S9U8N6_9CAUD|nr:Sak4-like ssDNA annealing protein [Streptomyces phage Hiyaa]AZS06684.1 DNA recombinase [Streptomyces phage Hiyaa]